MNHVVSWQDYAHSRSEARPEWGWAWDGLVGLWVPRLGPTGATLYDLTGNGNDGTLTNMDPATDWVAGENGWALDFDGSDDYVDLGTCNEYDFGTRPFTLMVTHYQFNVGTGHDRCMWGHGVYNNGWVLYTYDGFTVYLGGGRATWSNTGAMNVWMTTTFLRDSSNTIHAYRNATEMAFSIDQITGSTRNASSTLPTFIGKSPSSGEFYGYLSRVLLYNRALSPAEVAELSREPLGLLVRQPRYYLFPQQAAGPPTTGARAFWPMLRGSKINPMVRR